jgi:hypothetical protein
MPENRATALAFQASEIYEGLAEWSGGIASTCHRLYAYKKF